MPYITREDGERFIIPSYRDTLSAKKANLLRREITLLSANYGEYVSIQKKGADQYEVAFSPDPGYLLGECIWDHFNRPYDMVYCEAIPNTTEAILVIVKAGSVYLDGSFSIDSIPEELVIFKTQKNNFDIFIYGDVPISRDPEDGKFSFDSSSVRDFVVLDEPVFPTLQGVSEFQLQLVDVALRAYGFNVLPIKKIVIVLVGLICLYVLYNIFSTTEKPTQVMQTFIAPTDPYAEYNANLSLPAPDLILKASMDKANRLTDIPGWNLLSLEIIPHSYVTALSATVRSSGGRTALLLAWSRKHFYQVDITSGTVHLMTNLIIPNRKPPRTINSMLEINSALIDRLSYIVSGSALTFGKETDKVLYKEEGVQINLSDTSPTVILAIADALKDLPLVIDKMSYTISENSMSCSINLRALGK